MQLSGLSGGRATISRAWRGHVAVESGSRDTKAASNLFNVDLGVGQHRLCSFQVVGVKLWRPPSCSPACTGCIEVSTSALTDNATLKFGQCPENLENKPATSSRCVNGFGQRPESDAASIEILDRFNKLCRFQKTASVGALDFQSVKGLVVVLIFKRVFQ